MRKENSEFTLNHGDTECMELHGDTLCDLYVLRDSVVKIPLLCNHEINCSRLLFSFFTDSL